MRKYILGIAALTLITFALTFISWTPITLNWLDASNRVETHKSSLTADSLSSSLYEQYLKKLYDSVHLAQSGLSLAVFEKAVTGFYNLRNSGKISDDKSILSIADFDVSSTQKRLWIIDLDKKKLLLNTWVAHGQRSGADKAVKFSNINDSYQSSIGFYVTGEIYTGQHGRSLRLDGMDAGYNSNARSRSIVVHGANYVSQGTINALGRLGRSQGCPAVAPELANTVINAIGGKTVLFINSSIQEYSSKYLDEHTAAVFANAETPVDTGVMDTTFSI